MRKEVWKKLFLLFCILFCFIGSVGQSSIIKAETVEKEEKSQFRIVAKTALDNCTKMGCNTQMEITITNNGGDFNGLVRILTAVYDENIMYQKAFSIEAGGTKTLNIPFRMQSGCEDIVVQILDRKESILGQKKVKVNLVDGYQYLCGVLTDNKQGMGYLEEYGEYFKVIWLNKDNMPKTTMEIDALNRIYINDFSTAKLSKDQYKVLKNWIKKGGDLVLGTGTKVSDVLEIFQDDFLKGDIGGQTADGKAELSFEGEKVYQDKEDYAIHHIPIGKGNVFVYNINLSVSVEEWREKGIRYMEYQLRQQFGTIEVYDKRTENNVYLGPELSFRDVKRLPDIVPFGIVFLIYIVCVSGGIYFILKKRDKLEKAWVAVPVLSLLFVVLVYIMGSKTRIVGPFIMYRGAICFSGEEDTNPSEKNILKVSSSSNSDYALAIPKGRTIYSEIGERGEDEIVSTDSYKVGFYQGKEHQYVSIKDVSTFENNILVSEQKREMGQGYKSEIRCEGFQCHGTFTNNTGYTLKDAFLKTEYASYKLGNIKNGETVEINEKTPRVMFSYDDEISNKKMSELLFGKVNKKELTIEDIRYRLIIDTSEGYYYTSNNDEYAGEVYAYIDANEDEKKMNEEWGIDCEGITTCKMPIKIDYQYKGDSFIPNILLKATNIDTMIDRSDWSFDYTKTKNVDIEYALQPGETLTGLYYLKESNTSIQKNSGERIFQGEVLAYNDKTKKYDVIFESGKEKKITEVGNYVDEKNKVKIRIRTDKTTTEDSAWEELPKISLTINKKK